MTMFEQLCKTLGVGHNTFAEQLVSEMVNEMIFDESREYTDDEIIAAVTKRFKEAEKAVAKAKSIKPRPRYFVANNWHKHIARIGRYNVPVNDPLYGYYIDIQTPFGSDNRDLPEVFPTYQKAQAYVEAMGFKPVY